MSQHLLRTLALIALALCPLAAQQKPDPLKAGFELPPASARPRVWWHWMNGNITQHGIQQDLEWMKRVGIAGFQNFDAALATPQIVDKRLVYMTPEWKAAFRYATELADKLGLEMAIAGSPGWSETGGPWVPPAEGMKKYVWSELTVEGGKPFTGAVPHPPTVTGPFQNVPGYHGFGSPAEDRKHPQHYADVAVIAYRKAATDVSAAALHPKMSASAGAPNYALLDDGDLNATAKLPIPQQVGEKSWIQYEFATPQTMRALTFASRDLDDLTIAATGVNNPVKTLEASDDGASFRVVAKLPIGGAAQHTIAFAPVTARYFRVVFERTPPPPPPFWLAGMDPASLGGRRTVPTDFEIAECALLAGARVNRFEDKAAFVPHHDLYSLATPDATSADAIDKSTVVDLTAKLRADSTLDWTPGPGTWVVVRLGYSLLGITNHPATAEATGLEVDKLNGRYVRNYMNGYLDSYRDTVGAALLGKRGIQYVITDSWEAGSQNWTDDMLQQFRNRRGYDPTPYLPVLTGHVVESATASDRFLWDLRRTIADLIAEQHYGQIRASLTERGLGHYGESHESGRAFPADGMQVKKLADVPMAAMWTQTPGVNKDQPTANADNRESASVAHIYGQNIAAAESLTASAAPWAWSPATLKPTADQLLLNGINRFVIHEVAHQPVDDKFPGLTLGPFGQWFGRHETWAEQAGAWIDYLARSSYLLQQGRFAADVVYYYGEDSNLTAIFGDRAADVPSGYAYDYINADALMHELRVADGALTTKSGMRYRVLALDKFAAHMSVDVLRALHKLVQAGAIVAGAKPVASPSLADNAAEFTRLADALFGDGTGVRNVGKGRVYAGSNAAVALKALNVASDFAYDKPDTRIEFVHRHIDNGDIYFVSNRGDASVTLNATFRVAGLVPEIWHAERGTREPASYVMENGGTRVSVALEPWGSQFVVFRGKAASNARTVPAPAETNRATLDGAWDVAFQAGRGAPAQVRFDKLIAWNEHADAGVKYFSGAATYTQSVNVDAQWLKSKLTLDLGDVANLAEVLINGKSLGVVWHAPYRVDVTSALKPGANTIQIKVVNAWVNRMIGDQQKGVEKKITWADIAPYKADSPLHRSGLLGPVRLISMN